MVKVGLRFYTFVIMHTIALQKVSLFRVTMANYQLAVDCIRKQKVHLKAENALNARKQEWVIIELYISSVNQLKRLK